MKNYMQSLSRNAENILSVMSAIRDISLKETDNEKIDQAISSIHQEIVKGIVRIQSTIDKLMLNVEWNSFNVSFFGETNAGKSTTIGALLQGDDEGIGDGRKDFTQRKLSRTWNGVHLMDMPGIEGNERKYEEEIRNSVTKSHIIFYVTTAAKEPEDGTLLKIKKYLKDQAKVYIILNIRARPSVYTRVKELISENTKVVQARTEDKVRSIIGTQYKGSFMLNSHLAYISVGKPTREDFINDRSKAISIFGSIEQAYDFSRFGDLEDEIKRLYEQAPKEIAVNNTFKLVHAVESVLSSILREKKNFDTDIRFLKTQVKEATLKVEHIINKYNQEIMLELDSQLDLLKSDMQRVLGDSIDKEYKENEIKGVLERTKNQHEGKIKKRLDDHISRLREDITDVLNDLRKRIDLGLKFNGIKNGDINLGEIIRTMQLSFEYIFGQIFDIGLTIVGIVTTFAINPILGVVTIVIGVLRKLWDWFFNDPAKRKREAKDKAYFEIDKSVKSIKKEVATNMSREVTRLERSVKMQLDTVNQFVRSIDKLSYSLSEQIRELNISRIQISNLLIEYVSSIRPQITILDLHLRRAACISPESIFSNLDILQLQKFEQFTSMNQILNELDIRIDNEILYYLGKDEFHYRMLSSINDYYASISPSHPIKRVRRG
ncbi:GTPase [Paenibacillus sp. NPDC057934]|uniref:GTPase n=1 Tax=Paenibacillus sp. NPDC057934 TaxID=3346282 RepID=UPI0036D85A80